MTTLEKTVTYIARPQDSRCRWWSAIIEPSMLEPRYLEERAPFEYLKKGMDLELAEGVYLIDSEENHHRKQRGYTVLLGRVFEGKVHWIAPDLRRKVYIKENGGQDLMKGSGDVTAILRMAMWIERQPDKQKAFNELLYCNKE